MGFYLLRRGCGVSIHLLQESTPRGDRFWVWCADCRRFVVSTFSRASAVGVQLRHSAEHGATVRPGAIT